jgi:corrinoid protein of di/trimethylamine methyltransferase
MADFPELYAAILNGDEKSAAQQVGEALNQGANPAELISRWMIPAMDEVGRLFEAQEFYVPELLLAGRAMKAALDPLRPLLAASGAQPTGRVVIGTVKGDLHDIGKNLVGSMLEGAGFDVFDLGIDVPAEKFLEAVKTRSPNIVALSALLTVTMPEMKKTIEALNKAGIREQVKVLIGGAPVTRDYAESIGADGYGDNASSAVTVARSLLGK